MNNRALFFVFIPFLFLAGCRKEKGKVLAKVGKTIFTEEEFYLMIPPQYISMLTPAQKKEILKNWIDTELLYQEALKEKIDKESQVKSRIYEMGREIIANEFLERYITKMGGVDDSEVIAYFERHKEEYNTERQVAQIVVRDESHVYEIIEKLNEGKPFSKLAAQYSIDPSSKNGGLVGYIRRGDMPNLPEFEDAVYSIKEVGAISEPIRTVYGYHIVKLLDIRKTDKEVDYENIKDNIRNLLILSKQKKIVSDLLVKLRKEKVVEENYGILE
ncbi:MAG: peptidylprolyl isomerase [bacterium]|nr:peptidylprolyl isomerase [bacterium]